MVLFTQKFVIRLSKIWVWDPGSRIQGQNGTGSRIRIRNTEKRKIRESVPDAVCNLVRGKPAHSQHTSTRHWHLK